MGQINRRQIHHSIFWVSSTKGQSGQPGIERQNINAIYFSREFSFNQVLCDAHYLALNIYFSACAFGKSYDRQNCPKINAS
jgi:hypothetical protein